MTNLFAHTASPPPIISTKSHFSPFFKGQKALFSRAALRGLPCAKKLSNSPQYLLSQLQIAKRFFVRLAKRVYAAQVVLFIVHKPTMHPAAVSLAGRFLRPLFLLTHNTTTTVQSRSLLGVAWCYFLPTAAAAVVVCEFPQKENCAEKGKKKVVHEIPRTAK